MDIRAFPYKLAPLFTLFMRHFDNIVTMMNVIMEITETRKGKALAILNGFQYCVKRKGSVVTWFCAKEKTEKCRGTLVTEEKSILRVTEHACKPNVPAVEIKKCIVNANKEDNEFSPMSKIYKKEVNGIFNQCLDLVTDNEIPAFSSAKSTLNRIENNARGVIQNPATAQDIHFPEDIWEMGQPSFLPMKNAEFLFLQVESNQKDRLFYGWNF
ncbi:hypothetical protein FQA39_LY07523 [Lamprigera yunnana]|nr:hypothetical protein FQA39_LY07523 [Lamprigera yunnana]